jgi:nucleoside-diphosphate-sugar epimerase
MDKPARILVTGCLGNIGRAISARLIEAGWLVDGLDLPKKRSQMRPSGLSVHYLDLGDEATSSGRITEHLDGVTGVIHLALAPPRRIRSAPCAQTFWEAPTYSKPSVFPKPSPGFSSLPAWRSMSRIGERTTSRICTA